HELRGDALARIGHDDADLLLVALESQLDATTTWGELDGVREKVPHDLLQPVGVARDRTHTRIEQAADVDALRIGRGMDRVDLRLDDRWQRHRPRIDPEPPGDHARHVQQIADQARLGATTLLDDVEGTHDLGRSELP